MASFTSLPAELKSKIIAEIVLSTTEDMAKDVNPYSEFPISIALRACQEKLFPLATASRSFMKGLIDACWLYGHKAVVIGFKHSEDQVSTLQFVHHWYATVMCNAYEHDGHEGPYPEYWLYHRCYDPELEAGIKKEPAKEVTAGVMWESPCTIAWEDLTWE